MNLENCGSNGSVQATVPELQTDGPEEVCLLFDVELVVGEVLEALDDDELLLEDLDELDEDELLLEDLDELDDDELVVREELDELDDDELVLDVLDFRGARVVVLTVDVGVVETHELAGTTVVFTVELVCVLPFESIEITSVSIADVIELHDVVDFRGARVVVLTVDVGVVDTQELAGTTVVFFVELVCVLPFESIEITSDSITDVIELHDVVDLRGARVVVLTVDVGVVDTHELAGTTVVFFVELVCVLPFESTEITSDSITDVIELHDVVDFFDGFTVDLVVDVGVVDTHELAGTTVVFFVELVCVLPFESTEITSDSTTDVIELHDLLGFGVRVVERHELSGTIVVIVVARVCVTPRLSTDVAIVVTTLVSVLHDVVV